MRGLGRPLAQALPHHLDPLDPHTQPGGAGASASRNENGCVGGRRADDPCGFPLTSEGGCGRVLLQSSEFIRANNSKPTKRGGGGGCGRARSVVVVVAAHRHHRLAMYALSSEFRVYSSLPTANRLSASARATSPDGNLSAAGHSHPAVRPVRWARASFQQDIYIRGRAGATWRRYHT